MRPPEELSGLGGGEAGVALAGAAGGDGAEEAGLGLRDGGHGSKPTRKPPGRASPNARLTDAQEKFCFLLAQGKMVKEAWPQAGYSCRGVHWEKEASKLANLPKIRERRDALSARMREAEVNDVGITRGLIRTRVFENALDAKAAKRVTCPSCEHDFTYYMPDYRASNQALELLGLDQGMFARRADIRFGKIDPFEGIEGEELRDRLFAFVQSFGWGPWFLEQLSVTVGIADAGGPPPPRALPAQSEAGRVSSAWEDAPATGADGRQPVWEKYGRSGGGGDARDGALPGVVGGTEVPGGDPLLGGGDHERDDARQRAEALDWTRR